jgi:hypothetical protein
MTTCTATRRCKLLLAADDSAELRERVRSALRRAVETVTCLFVGIGKVRLAAVRVQFRGGDAHRDYLIICMPAKANKHARLEGSWHVRSFADEAAGLDMRKPRDAAKLARVLGGMDLSAL